MISLVFSIISVLSYSTCPYIPWEWMILPGEQPVSTVCYIEYIYIYILGVCMNYLNCLISVLSYFACPYTHWKQMILLTYKYHVISVYIFHDCMNDISIVKCNCDMLIDKSLYTLKAKRSCPFINFWTTVHYVWCINCVIVWKISPVLSIVNVVFHFTCLYTHWKRMILPIDQHLSTLWYMRWTYLMFYEWS